MKRLHLSLGMLALGLMLGSCAKSPSDDSLANDIKAKLYADSATKQANVQVAVANGVVTLSGNAPNSDSALAAVNDANSVSGVKRVDNQIAVGGQLPNAGEPTPPVASAPPPPPPNPAGQANPNQPDHRDEHAEEHREHEHEHVAVTVPAGTRIDVRTTDTITSSRAAEGQTYRASLAEPIVVDGREVAPREAPATLVLVAGHGAGRIEGRSELELRVASIEIHGRRYDVATSDVTETGNARGKQTAIRTGIGAAAGAVIGALAGGGKGAAIGSAAGGGAGFGFQALTHGKQVDIPSESILRFTLQQPLAIE